MSFRYVKDATALLQATGDRTWGEFQAAQGETRQEKIVCWVVFSGIVTARKKQYIMRNRGYNDDDIT